MPVIAVRACESMVAPPVGSTMNVAGIRENLEQPTGSATWVSTRGAPFPGQ